MRWWDENDERSSDGTRSHGSSCYFCFRREVHSLTGMEDDKTLYGSWGICTHNSVGRLDITVV
jgi:hypothetical protein